jgi:tryptophanyl-tRNA synthetase
MGKKIALSGVKPSGDIHIGNYFGAIKQFVDLQDEYDLRIFVADLHALTSVKDREKMQKEIQDVVLDYLAVGIDPEKVTIYQQSDFPEITEIGWIFNCITTMPQLMRAHSFKDAEAKNKDINVGVFDYPLLMAADILVHDADIVPVGRDQIQHVEIARDVARKFNSTFGDTFNIPESKVIEETQIITGLDGEKMSKSKGNTIPLFTTEEETLKLVKKITTDSKDVSEPKDPDSDTVFALHKLVTEEGELEELRKRYVEGGIGYGESKEILAKNINSFLAPFREKREELVEDVGLVEKVLKEGREKALSGIEDKLEAVRKAVGLIK